MANLLTRNTIVPDGNTIVYGINDPSGTPAEGKYAPGAYYQPLDGTLSAFAALVGAADKLPYFTGPDAFSLADLSAFGRSLIDDANQVAAQATLGLIIGTNVQAYDSTLAALAGYNTNGLLTQTATDTFTGRTLTGPAAGITVSNGDGVSGNPTLALANDLLALEGLSSTGLAVRSASDTWIQRSIAVGAGAYLSVSNGDGVSGNPTLDLADAELLALAGLISAADKLPYFTGSGTAALADFSSFARTLVDDASASTARSTLGLGTIATVDSPVPIGNGGSGQTTQQAAIDALTNVAAATNEHVLTKDTATGNALWKVSSGGGGSSLPVADTQTIVKGSVDATKLLRFEVDGFTTGVTRVLTPPNADATIAGLEVANIFTAAQTQQGSGAQTLTIRSTNNQARLNVISQSAGAGDWLFGTGGNGSLGSDAFFFYSQISPVGFKVEIDKSGQVYIASTLSVASVTIPTSPLTPVAYFGSGSTARIGINSTANAGVGFYISDTLKWSATAYKPSGTNYSFVFFNDQTVVNSLFINGDDDNIICGVPTTTGDFTTYARFNAYTKDATTNTVKNEMALVVDSSGTPVAGFGGALRAILKSSTTVGQDAGKLSWEWATATHASRKALSKWTVYDTAEREGIRIEADGSNPMIGFLGKTAIARPASYTLASTATRTMPTPEATFTGQDNLQVGNVYAKSTDLITLQTRLDSVEGVLRQLIIDLASTSGYGLLVAS